MRVICHHPSFATSPPASKSALLHSGIPQRTSVSGGSTCSSVRSSALGTFFPADKLPARAKERAWKRASEEAGCLRRRGPPTHPFSLPSFLPSSILGECARPSASFPPSPFRNQNGVRTSPRFFPIPFRFLPRPAVFADRGARRESAVLTRPSKHPRGARRHSSEGGR